MSGGGAAVTTASMTRAPVAATRQPTTRCALAAASSAVALLLLLPVLLLAVGGCGAGAEPPALDGEAQREWQALQQMRTDLVERRRQLAAWRRELAVEQETSNPPSERAYAELAARAARAEDEIASRSDAFGQRLVAFIDALAVPNGERPPRERSDAIRLKSDEDLDVAGEWIERGGDYRRAIEIYELQRRLDPRYERLATALAEAREMRFVTAERFARVGKGMTRGDVRAALGPVNLRMIRSYPERGVEAWLYPKAGGGTAAVFFRRDGTRRALVVYATSFDLRPPPTPLRDPSAAG
jgi:hypothetical protein